MRLKTKLYICCTGFLLLYIIFRCYLGDRKEENPLSNNKYLLPAKLDKYSKPKTVFLIKEYVSLVLRSTADTAAYLNATVTSFTSAFPKIPIIIVSDLLIIQHDLYLHNITNIELVNLDLDLLHVKSERNPLNEIKTKYVLIVPVGVVVSSNESVLNLVNSLIESTESVLAVPVHNTKIKCLRLNLNALQWILEYYKEDGNICDAIDGHHAIFTETDVLRQIPEPFMLPFPEALYIQLKTIDMKIKVIESPSVLKFVGTNASNAISVNHRQAHRKVMYYLLKIKKVLRETGKTEWFGCSRKTFRCFPSVSNSVPEFLMQGRWTPPCCLSVLRETARHVFKTLEKYNITYWLEGGSLLGAMRSKDIIPWDYDVDVGIYLKDVGKCPWLKKIHLDPKKKRRRYVASVVDDEGFVWEQAQPQEGDFYRVQASKTNRLHVDIFPFYSKNGIMTKNTWFVEHVQDKEFPEHYLKPLTTIEFAGVNASAPNNIREFLELKFGKGCVENPRYPDGSVFPIPKKPKETFLSSNDDYDLV